MNKIKIFGGLTHYKLKVDKKTGRQVCYPGPVDFYRVMQPLKYLPKDRFEVDVDYDFYSRFGNAEGVTNYYDIMFMSYIDTVDTYLKFRVLGIKNKMKMVIDLDDNLWNVDPTHPFYKSDFAPGSEKNFNRSAMFLDADGITTTNSFLRYQMIENIKIPIKQVEILPNFIDLTEFDYKNVVPSRSKDKFIIGYLGGSSHFPDMNKSEFLDALKIIMDKYPQVRFKTCFYMPHLKALFGYKYEYEILGSGERYRKEGWPKMMEEFSCAVAPLVWSKYSRSKSYVKYLEYSAAKVPSICEKIDPYNEVLLGHEERGFLASSTEDWVKHFEFLITHPKEAKDIGEEAYKYIKKDHTIQNPKNIQLYTDYFEKIYKQKGKEL